MSPLCLIIGWFMGPIWLATLAYCTWEHWLLEKQLYPDPARTSIAEVRRLIKEGKRREAILCYLKKFPQISLRDAVYAVDSLK